MTRANRPGAARDERHSAARRVAAELERRGLTTPALLLLEAHRPVAPLIGAAATFLAPLIGRVAPGASELVALTEDEHGIDRLLEELRPEPDTPEERCRTSVS